MNTLWTPEERMLGVLGICTFGLLGYAWGVLPVLLVLPGISKLGYLINPELRAFMYMIGCYKSIAIAVYFIRVCVAMPVVQLVGGILLVYAVIDRIFVSGAIYATGFTCIQIIEIRNNYG